MTAEGVFEPGSFNIFGVEWKVQIGRSGGAGGRCFSKRTMEQPEIDAWTISVEMIEQRTGASRTAVSDAPNCQTVRKFERLPRRLREDMHVWRPRCLHPGAR